jgi:hypothetical protein
MFEVFLYSYRLDLDNCIQGPESHIVVSRHKCPAKAKREARKLGKIVHATIQAGTSVYYGYRQGAFRESWNVYVTPIDSTL